MTPQKWAEEHVVPQWLLDHLEISAQDQLFQGLAGTADNEVTLNRVHASRRFVEGRVCSVCNNTWMSRLETSAKQILIDLIENRRTVSDLTLKENAIVAKWTVKSAYVLANVSIAGKPVASEHLWSLSGDNGTIPARVEVLACQTPWDQNISFIQIGYWPQIIREGGARRDSSSPEDAYKIAIQYRHLNLLVAYWPHEPSQFAIAAGFHVPVWPRHALFFPSYVNSRLVPLGSSLPALKAFAESLAVITP
jgi:hypothetical protein